MKKVFKAEDIKSIDAATIRKENITSHKLMERAAHEFVRQFLLDYNGGSLYIFAGVGNNGGDALAISRMLLDRGISNRVFLCKISNVLSADCQKNLQLLQMYGNSEVIEINQDHPLPMIQKGAYVIDGIFGTGLNRPVEGYWATLFHHINEHNGTCFSIDIPSGLYDDRLTESAHIHADHVISFEFPKLAYFIHENYNAVKQWSIASIGLDEEVQDELRSPYYYIDHESVAAIYKKRSRFDHKGTFGYVCIIGGSNGMIGAPIFAGKAALRSGSGLLVYQVELGLQPVIQSADPEGMVIPNIYTKYKIRDYYTYGIGCGLGSGRIKSSSLISFLSAYKKPVVLDADGLNILSKAKKQNLIPELSIITPHEREFERLFGECNDGFERLELARKKAIEHKIFICLKGSHTAVVCPDGSVYFNSSGNPGMAVAGSGDVLTGIITSLFAQQYSQKEAALMGVYLHGLAGDLATAKYGEHAVTPLGIIEQIPFALQNLIE